MSQTNEMLKEAEFQEMMHTWNFGKKILTAYPIGAESSLELGNFIKSNIIGIIIAIILMLLYLKDNKVQYVPNKVQYVPVRESFSPVYLTYNQQRNNIPHYSNLLKYG